MKLSSLNSQILHIALPSIAANIATPLLSVADTAIAGHLGSARPLAAIAVGGSIFTLIYWLFAFLRMGTGGLTAQAFGRNDHSAMQQLLARGLMISIFAGFAMVMLQRPLLAMMLRFMDADAPTALLVDTYFSITVWGAPAVLATFTMTGWFLGRQNTRITMWVAIIANVSNIIISLTAVTIFDAGIAAIAIGTLSAQWLGAVILLMKARRDRFSINPFKKYALPHESASVGQFLNVNIYLFLRTFCLVAVTLWFTRTGARQGAEILAVNSVLLQFFLIFSYTMDGFAFAAEALTGRYVGANDHATLNRVVISTLKWGLAMATLFTIAYAAGTRPIVTLLTSDPAVRTLAREYTLWVAAIPLAGFMAFIFDGVFIGLTRTGAMLLCTLISMIAFFAVWHICAPAMANHALWLAFIAWLTFRGVVLYFIWKYRS